MNSLAERIAQAERDLHALKSEARRLDTTLTEIKAFSEKEELEQETPAPPPLPAPQVEEKKPEPQVEPEPKPLPLAPIPTPVTTYSSNFEMQLGRVWFVRLGIVLLTTGLVFLSSYTYKTFIQDLGPEVRLTLLYLFTILLTGAGLFCERWKDSLKHYGRIVTAGGLASIYYTSYAAHNVEALRVIESPVIGSILLLLTAGLCGVISIWKRSPLTLGTSLALAFYSITLNPVGWMVGLFALILATGGSLIARHRNWPKLHFITLIGSYLTYTSWAFLTAEYTPETRWFLLTFWLFFVVLTLFEKLPQHSLFSGLNHTAFFLLISLNPLTKTWIESLWIFCILMGASLLILGILARARFPRDTTILHLTKGLGLITLGLILKLSGHQLFLTLLLEAVVLSGLHLQLKKRFLFVASCLIAALAGYHSLIHDGPSPAYAWAITAGLWGVFALLHRLTQHELDEDTPYYLSIIGFLAMFLSLIFGAAKGYEPWMTSLCLGAGGIITTLLHFRRILTRYFVDAYWVSTFIAPLALLDIALLNRDPFILLAGAAVSMTLSFCQSLKITELKYEGAIRQTISIALYALGFLLVAISIHHGIAWVEHRMLLFLALPIVGTLVASKTRCSLHASIPFLLHFALLAHFSFEQGPLLGGVLILAIHLALLRALRGLADSKYLEAMTFVFINIMWFGFLWLTIQQDLKFYPFLSWTGAGVLLLHRFYPKTLVLLCAIPFLTTGIAGAFLEAPSLKGEYLQVYLGLFPLLAIHAVSCYRNASTKYHVIGVLALLTLWATISKEAHQSGLVASWAILGTLTLLVGLLAKSRTFRITALMIFACSLGHIMMIDIVKLDPLPRILSFITLGLGLLGLGFVYNRWQDQLKQIL